MNKKLWNRARRALLLALALVLSLTACSGGGGKAENLLLYLSFDEGSGNQVSDGAGRVQPAEVNYLFTNAAYMESRDPEWRTEGVQGGCLLFDGNSNYVSYEPEELLVQGEALTVSVWAAPRAFEWDDPNAAANGTEHLTAIAGQYNKDKKQGFLLGYERYGRLCFQVGTGERWLTLWAEDGNLSKDQWNHVAAVFDGKAGAMSLYLNGSPVGELAIEAGVSIAPAEKERLLIGKNAHGEAIAAGSYQMFSGYMDELKVYGGVLSPEAVAEASLAARAPRAGVLQRHVPPVLPAEHGGDLLA